MCVIMVVSDDKKRPTDHMISKAWDRNGDGAGIAYREVGKDGTPEVVWRKGLELAQITEYIRTAPIPYVVHFRLKSIGAIRPNLCHPFSIDKQANIALKGRTKGWVLFHNGTWDQWADTAKYAALTKGMEIPRGKWSDSRAIAWMCSIYGLGFMEFLPDQRGVAFGPNDGDLEIFWGKGWTRVNDILCSNDLFMNHTTTYHHGPACRYGACQRKDVDSDVRCPMHPLTSFPNPNTQVGGSQNSGTEKKNVAQEVATASDDATPFQQGQGASQEALIPLDTAERMHLNNQISKNVLKDIRRAYDVITHPHPHKKDLKNANKRLRKITEEIFGPIAPVTH